MTETKKYTGKIRVSSHGDAEDILFIGDENDPFAETLERDLDRFGRQVTVNYHITETELSEDQLNENLIRRISGDATAEYRDAWSEYTGYLWTDEELNVGGHNLLDELKSNRGKYLFMTVHFGAKPLTPQTPAPKEVDK